MAQSCRRESRLPLRDRKQLMSLSGHWKQLDSADEIQQGAVSNYHGLTATTLNENVLGL
ncbi:hypothetical protein AAFJ72_17720 [Brevibacillus gelatini]|uniref:hypothetical protein n=1 Tax=Brevibacillus gelatini TaxID=1655277 RepID=UPI003D81BEA4